METYNICTYFWLAYTLRLWRIRRLIFPIEQRTTAAQPQQHDHISFYYIIFFRTHLCNMHVLVPISQRSLLFISFRWLQSNAIARRRYRFVVVVVVVVVVVIMSPHHTCAVCSVHSTTMKLPALRFHSNSFGFGYFGYSLTSCTPADFTTFTFFFLSDAIFLFAFCLSPLLLLLMLRLCLCVFFFKFSIVLNLVKWFHKNCQRPRRRLRETNEHNIGCTRTFLTIFA